MPTDTDPSIPVEDGSASVDPDGGDRGQAPRAASARADEPASDDVDTGPDPEPAAPSDEVASLRATVAELEARLRTVSAAYRQQQDEIAATKERLARQASLKEELRRGEVVGTLFEPVENLRRSLEVLRKVTEGDAVTGLELVLNQFFEAFRQLGLEEVPGKGSRFDPNLHEALTAMPVSDPALDGVVIEVFDKGYRIGSRLLKASRVVIGQHQDNVGEG